jgi:hypothetical protein
MPPNRLQANWHAVTKGANHSTACQGTITKLPLPGGDTRHAKPPPQSLNNACHETKAAAVTRTQRQPRREDRDEAVRWASWRRLRGEDGRT